MPGGKKRYDFPNLDDTTSSALLCMPMPLVPFMRRFFQDMQQRHIWNSADDWRRAYQAFATMESELMAGCLQQLIDEQRRLYRLWDTALNGTQYTVVAGTVITPEIPAVPPASVGAPNAMRAHIGRLWQLGENVVAGTTASAGEGIDGAPALADDTTARQLLRRLIAGIDGNGTPAPADNLLTALRGTAQAGADRNVIDALSNQADSEQLADILAAVHRLRGVPPVGEEPDLRVDMAMLQTALLALRGTGPENTLRSINQSIWNLAGPAPGRSLVDLYNLLTYEESGTPNIVWTAAGLLHVIRLALYNSDRTLDAADLLERINNAIGGEPNSSLEIASVRGLLDKIRVNTGNMADCCESMNANPFTKMPPGVCANPIKSTGSSFVETGLINTTPYTVATWPQTIGNPDFSTSYGVISQAYSSISCPNWMNYRIYVASRSDVFGISILNSERFSCNQWISLSIFGPVDFLVAEDNSLVVYICPASLGTCPGSEDPRVISSWQPGNKPIGSGMSVWELGDSTGGGTWSSGSQFSVDAYWPPQNAIQITRNVPNVGLCIAWNASGEPSLTKIGVRGFFDEGGSGSEVGQTVGDIVIAVDGTSGSLIREVNIGGGYSPNDFALIPYLAFAGAHAVAPNVEVSISFVELTAS